MGRNYYINGTNTAGEYSTLTRTKGLPNFLSEQGVLNLDYATNVITDLSGAFRAISGIDALSSKEAPLALRYVPMYLSNRPDMNPGILPIYAITVCGSEQRSRESSYSFISLLSSDDMKESEDYTYLDQIFGTQRLNWQDINQIREGKKIRLGEPEKIHIKFLEKDLATFVIQTIYKKQRILIRLEKGCSFNDRVVEVLQEIYGLMDPRLAIETGFASFETEAAIDDHAKTTGVKIFVLPAEAPEIQKDDLVFIDLEKPETYAPEKDDIKKAIDTWLKILSDKGMAEFYPIFSAASLKKFYNDEYNRAGYIDADQYLEISNAFFEEYNQFVSSVSEKEVSGVAELFEFYQSFPLLSVMGEWYKDLFRDAVYETKPLARVLQNNSAAEFNKLLTYEGWDSDEGVDQPEEPDENLLQFLVDMLGLDNAIPIIGTVAQNGIDKERAQLLPLHKKEVADLKQQLNDQKAEFDQNLNALAAECAQKLADKDEACGQKLAQIKEACEQEKANLVAGFEEQINDLNDTIEGLNRQITEINDKCAAQLEDAKEACEAEKTAIATSYEEKIVALKESYQKTIDELNYKLSHQEEELSRMVDERTKEIALEIERRDATIESLNTKNSALNAELQGQRNEVRTLKQQIRNLDTSGEMAAMQKKINAIQSSLSAAESQNYELQEASKTLREKLNSANDVIDSVTDDYKSQRKKTILCSIFGVLGAVGVCAAIFGFVLQPRIAEDVSQKVAKEVSQQVLDQSAEQIVESFSTQLQEKAGITGTISISANANTKLDFDKSGNLKVKVTVESETTLDDVKQTYKNSVTEDSDKTDEEGSSDAATTEEVLAP